MNTDNHSSTSKLTTIILTIIGVLILIGIIISRINPMNPEVVNLKVDKTILEMDSLKGKYVGVNKDQIIKITNDGVSAYDLNGQEVWSDTLTLESIWVQQREPYFIVSSKGSRKIAIFSDKGRQGEIVTQNPIIYSSINEKGDVVVVEETKEGHQVSAYTSRGEFIGSRVSYISSGVFPITAEITPDRKLLLVSYLGVSGSKITSIVDAMQLEKSETEKIDNVIYAVQEQDNLVYEIEFINNEEWVAIGDKSISIYNTNGEKIKTISGLEATYTPYLYKIPSFGSYLPVVAIDKLNSNGVHDKESLYIFDKLGEVVATIPFDTTIDYFYADDKGAIVGVGKQYKGYNKLGNQYFEFHSTQDISKLIYLNNEAVAITKDKVLLLKPTRNK